MHKFAVGTSVYVVRSVHDRLFHKVGVVVQQMPGDNQTIGGITELCYMVKFGRKIYPFPESYLRQVP